MPIQRVHTLVIGSGAAGLNAAVRLKREGLQDVLVLTEGLDKGTSINTGSDKQTYYKLGLSGTEPDSPRLLAETLFAGGSMHGDLALVEAALSATAFSHLVALGVAFPHDAYGQYVGYKTDHDPRRRATSVGPYTSRDMCRALIAEIRRLGIPVREGRTVVRLLTVRQDGGRRAVGGVAFRGAGRGAGAPGSDLDLASRLEVILADNVVFATGGPGGLYKASVYPSVHTGGIGLALAEGAEAANLAESQFGLASVAFRWNVSGTYMQVVPRVISTAADGRSDEREFLRPFFPSVSAMHNAVFLKGYQWPFDARKAAGGSSLLDVLVHLETVVKGRRVFLDYRTNPAGFALRRLCKEAFDYLRQSGALTGTPLDRLRHMNPAAVALYLEHGIDLARQPLEIAVCAQHNNGGLASDAWWQSTTIRHLFPVGEVNGSHGVTRPGGSALNAGQVGGWRAACYIARRYADYDLPEAAAYRVAEAALQDVADWVRRARSAERTWQEERNEFQARMTAFGAHLRRLHEAREALADAARQYERIEREGCAFQGAAGLEEALRNRSLCLAHRMYMAAIVHAIRSGVGSRGSALVLAPSGQPLHPKLDAEWRMVPENPVFRNKVQSVVFDGRTIRCAWRKRRALPSPDDWFETVWKDFRTGQVYGGKVRSRGG